MDAQDYLLQMEKDRLERYRMAVKPIGIRDLLAHIYKRVPALFD